MNQIRSASKEKAFFTKLFRNLLTFIADFSEHLVQLVTPRARNTDARTKGDDNRHAKRNTVCQRIYRRAC